MYMYVFEHVLPLIVIGDCGAQDGKITTSPTNLHPPCPAQASERRSSYLKELMYMSDHVLLSLSRCYRTVPR